MLIIQINKVCKELWLNFSVKQLSVVPVLCVSVTPSSDTLSRLHNFLSNRRIYFVPRGGISAFSAKSVSVRLYCSEVSLLSGVYHWSNCKWWGTILFNNFKEYFFSFSCSEPLFSNFAVWWCRPFWMRCKSSTRLLWGLLQGRVTGAALRRWEPSLKFLNSR